jgi:hypothetical protein
MIYRPARFEDYLARIETHGPTGIFKTLEPRQRIIEAGWDICPVCVRRSEVEYGASK